MARTKAKTAKGTVVSYSTTENGSYTPFAEVIDCGFPEISAPTTGADSYESDEDFSQKITTGYKEAADVPVKFYFGDGEAYSDAYDLLGEEYWFKIMVGGTSSGWNFLGSLTKLGGGTLPEKAAVEVDGAIAVLTKPQIVAS